MLNLLAAALVSAQPVAVLPVPVALEIVNMGSVEDQAGLERLLSEVWNPRGNLSAIIQRGEGRSSHCVTLGNVIEIDTGCVQARVPQSRDGRPVVVMFITPLHSGVHRHFLRCIGASGVGGRHVASLRAIPQSGLMSRQKNNDRGAVGSCINAAAPGSVVGNLW